MKTTITSPKAQLPVNFSSQVFAENKPHFYKLLRENAPVYKGKISILNAYMISRYADCVSVLKDPRFVRNRTTATGGDRLPFLVPKAVNLLSQSMITEDEPDHHRLRALVHQAFTARQLAKLETRIETLTHQLLDRAEPQGIVDLKAAYALPIPVTVIQEMMGVPPEDMAAFSQGMSALKDGFSGWSVFRTLVWDMPRLTTFVRSLIQRKRAHPQDDILTGLIQAEEAGESLSEDELISMVFLLIIAGYETTVQLITNGVFTLLQHPEQLAQLRDRPALMPSAIEEILRVSGPIHSTKPVYALEPVTLHGITIPKGEPVFPFIGAANRDPAAFTDPETFDIVRTPNKHLGFGAGIHACLGAPLARMETKIALKNLLHRYPNLRLAVPQSEVKIQTRPGWQTYEQLPVVLA